MTPGTGELLDEVVQACAAIERYVDDSPPSDLVLDAVRMRLVEIGAAVAALPGDLTASEPGIPWGRLAAIGDRLTNGRRPVSPPVLVWTARVDAPRLREASARLRDRHALRTGPTS